MIKRVKGMNDVFPSEAPYWRHLESTARSVFRRFGFGYIRTPILEHIELFERGVGETTDIVQKEMYTLEDRKGRKLALRPEGTAPVVRALIQKGIDGCDQVSRYFYFAPMYRYERPQKGRLREHHQLGAEIFGSDSPFADADLLIAIWSYLNQLGIENVAVHINSLGDQESRPKYRQALLNYLQDFKNDLSEDSKVRFEANPLRVLDSKAPEDQEIILGAPSMETFLSDNARDHYDRVLSLLQKNNIPFVKQPRLVRGLDYYTHTVFEFVADGIGAKSSVCGGGRYNNLVEDLGGKSTPAVGFGMGIERMILLLEQQKIAVDWIPKFHCAWMDESTKQSAYTLCTELRIQGLECQFDYKPRSLKNQLSKAAKEGYLGVFIIGENELKKDQVTYKHLSSGKQRTVSTQRLIRYFGQLRISPEINLDRELDEWTEMEGK